MERIGFEERIVVLEFPKCGLPAPFLEMPRTL